MYLPSDARSSGENLSPEGRFSPEWFSSSRQLLLSDGLAHGFPFSQNFSLDAVSPLRLPSFHPKAIASEAPPGSEPSGLQLQGTDEEAEYSKELHVLRL